MRPKPSKDKDQKETELEETECLGCDETNCQECCPHDETDHGECIDCGADRMDYLIGKAESQSEGWDR